MAAGKASTDSQQCTENECQEGVLRFYSRESSSSISVERASQVVPQGTRGGAVSEDGHLVTFEKVEVNVVNQFTECKVA